MRKRTRDCNIETWDLKVYIGVCKNIENNLKNLISKTTLWCQIQIWNCIPQKLNNDGNIK